MTEMFGIPIPYESKHVTIFFSLRYSSVHRSWKIRDLSEELNSEFILNKHFIDLGDLTFTFKNVIDNDYLKNLCQNAFEVTYQTDYILREKMDSIFKELNSII